jgi:hypothetical protein
MAKTKRNYRLDDDLIMKVKFKCAKLKTDVTKVITELLTHWVGKN